MFDHTHDARVRAAAFKWLEEQVAVYGDVLPRKILEQGFILDDVRVPLLGPQGIFKPKVLEGVPLSITTSPNGPYKDAFGHNGLLSYKYRGTDPHHVDNRGLKAAMAGKIPLIYFHGIAPGKYLATWPVFVVGDNQADLSFSIEVDDQRHIGIRPEEQRYGGTAEEEIESGRRSYITAEVRVRLHQRLFRERVLEAYQRQCAFCHLRHEELLDAAHIIPDSAPEGEPVVTNGLALCNLHHGAFDRFFIGVRPDYTIEVRPDILKEADGPTLRHAIQALHGTRILLPTRAIQRPDPALLEKRYEQFRESAAGRV